jgi:uncharacterized lipoprotein YmbA
MTNKLMKLILMTAVALALTACGSNSDDVPSLSLPRSKRTRYLPSVTPSLLRCPT